MPYWHENCWEAQNEQQLCQRNFQKIREVESEKRPNPNTTSRWKLRLSEDRRCNPRSTGASKKT